MVRPRRVVQVPGEAEKPTGQDDQREQTNEATGEEAKPQASGSLPVPGNIDATKLDRAVLTRDGWLVPDRPVDPRQMK
jgi:hypothetical protein